MFSVLMSVYVKEKPEFLSQSLDSIFNQQLVPNEVVLVKDGALTPELDKVIEDFEHSHPHVFKIVAFEKNQGLGIALREGLMACSYDIVARMDTDDICKPERFSTQVRFLSENPNVDVVGSNIDEFSDTPADSNRVRRVPETDSEIKSAARLRNPLNHMSVVFRKESVIKAGNYHHRLYFEDYDLWIRMIMKGFNFRNLQSSLLFVRTGHDLIGKRHGAAYARLEYNFFREHYRSGFFSRRFFLSSVTIRFIMRLVPKSILAFFYEKLLRTSAK